MLDIIQQVYGIYINYSGSSLYMVLFLLCLTYLYFTETDPGKKYILVYGSFILLGLFLFPLFSYLMIQVIFDGEVYYRFLWLLPINVMIAYGIVRLMIKIQNKKACLFIGTSILILFIVGGDYTYDNPMFVKAENIYHIPQEVIEVCDIIEPEQGEDWVMAVFPAEMLSFVRQYSTRIHMPYGRAVLIDRWNLGHPMFDTMESDIIDVNVLSQQASEYQCDYVIFPESKETSENMEQAGFAKMQEIDGYIIYKYEENVEE